MIGNSSRQFIKLSHGKWKKTGTKYSVKVMETKDYQNSYETIFTLWRLFNVTVQLVDAVDPSRFLDNRPVSFMLYFNVAHAWH
jgi:hypothetical protein